MLPPALPQTANTLIPVDRLARRVRGLLGLERQIAGVTFLDDPLAYEQSPIPALKRPLSYCTMVRLATIGRGRKASHDLISCPGARRALGLTPPDDSFSSGQRYFSFGLYKNLATAHQVARHIALMPGAVHGVAVQPMETCLSEPDIVICICTPNQAMRLVQGYAHQFGPTQPIRSLGMQGLCAELTAAPLLAQDLVVSLLCSNTRFTCAWKDMEMGVAMPYRMLSNVAEGLAQTFNATEHARRKSEILHNCVALGVETGISPGPTYYKT